MLNAAGIFISYLGALKTQALYYANLDLGQPQTCLFMFFLMVSKATHYSEGLKQQGPAEYRSMYGQLGCQSID